MKILHSKIVQIFISLFIIIILDYNYGHIYNRYLDKVISFYKPFLNQINPCSQLINYSLGDFDNRFNISEEEFVAHLDIAEAIWEKPLGRNIFNRADSGNLQINLVYDYRQEATDKLKKLGISIDNTRETYDKLKVNYDSLTKNYESKKIALDELVKKYKTEGDAYQKDVAYWNKAGGISKKDRKKLEATRVSLNNLGATINKTQDELKELVDEINATANVVNRLISELNLGASNYNTVGTTIGKEFQEGQYVRDEKGERITIYQFDDRNKLTRVLAHEFGHALGIEHNNNPDSIMYTFNEGKNEKLSAEDIEDMRSLCGIK